MSDKRPWHPKNNTEDEMQRANMALVKCERKAVDMFNLLIKLKITAKLPITSLKMAVILDLIEKGGELLKSVGWEGEDL
jgi:hypothetical protein